MPGRTYTASAGYRFGFNGKEKDDEVKGAGNSIDFGARVYDSRLGRFLSIDPYFKEFAWSTPYSYAVDNPIALIDNYGEAPGGANLMNATQTGTGKVVTETEKKIAKKFVEQTLGKAVRQAWWEPILGGAGAIISRAAGTITFVFMDQGLGKGDVVMNQLDKNEQIELQNLQGKKAQGIELSSSENSIFQELEYRNFQSSLPKYEVFAPVTSDGKPVFRGGNSFTLKEGEVRIDQGTGLVKTTRGISLNTDADKVSKYGGAYQITYLPDELKITQVGQDAGHYEIVPTVEMTKEKFQDLLNKIETKPVENK
jgi:RHS repeat-associated protein